MKVYTNLELESRGGNVEEEPGSRKLYQSFAMRCRHASSHVPSMNCRSELRRLRVPSIRAAPPVRVSEESTVPGLSPAAVGSKANPG